MSLSDTGADAPEMTNETFPDEDVRVEDKPVDLEKATPTHSHQSGAQTILEESGAVGGADNTGEPAGGNVTHSARHTQRASVADSDAAKENYQEEEVTENGG